MLVLAVDSSTPVASVALVDSTGVIAEYFLNTGYTHSEKLMPMIEEMMKQAHVDLEQLRGLVVASGPGSFTGLRIGMATIKTMAQVTGAPLVGINTLDGLAYNCVTYQGLICPVLNARKQEVYTAFYQSNGVNIERVSEYQAINPQKLAEIVKERKQPVMFVGDGVLEYKSLWQQELVGLALFAPITLLLPRSSSIAILGIERLMTGYKDDIFSLKPFYLRKSEAEIRLAQSNCS